MFKVNERQKKLLLICLGILVLSVLFVPQEISMLVGGAGEFAPKTKFQGYRFIAMVNGEIAMKHIFVEWMSLILFFSGMFLYLKEK